jgi:flavin reductase (DIM6/NTAB) family NADH-FMN oxidoreductase RutF
LFTNTGNDLMAWEGTAEAGAELAPVRTAPPAVAQDREASAEHVVIDPSILYLGTPVLLISTRNADGSANLAPISSSWFLGTVGVLGIGTRSHTIENLRRTGEAVLNFPSVDLVDAVDRLAATTGSSPLPAYKQAMGFETVKDKFGRAGLTEQPSDLVAPPRVREAPLQLEARVLAISGVGDPEENSAAVSVQVVRTHVAEAIRKPGHRTTSTPTAGARCS